MSYIDDAFDNLKSNLEITQTEMDLAKTRHNLIRDHIKGSWTLTDHFLTGSYARQTKTKKLKDVDIFVVVDPSGPQGSLAQGSGIAAIHALRNVLSTRWNDLETDENVVIINYPGEDVTSYEVAPVFARKGGGYLMPNGTTWMATDPTKHEDLVTAKNKNCDEKFVPFVKMVKGINREANDAIAPSFLLEVMGLSSHSSHSAAIEMRFAFSWPPLRTGCSKIGRTQQALVQPSTAGFRRQSGKNLHVPCAAGSR